jgi:hypothetical protein
MAKKTGEFDRREWIRKAAREGRVWWTRHAAQRLIREGLRRREAEHALESAEVIEWYLMQGRPFPGALTLAWVKKQPMHAVVAMDTKTGRLYMVTLYRPAKERWHEDCKTRKD